MDDNATDEFGGADENFEDFTTASDWELLTANLEQLLIQWQSKPIESEYIQQNWVVLNDKVQIADKSFQVGHYKELSNCDSTLGLGISFTDSHKPPLEVLLPPYLNSITKGGDNEFPFKFAPHVVAELFQLKEFAVISAEHSPIENESELTAIMSSICIALNNTSSNFPVFVQYHQRKQGYFCGIAESPGIRTSFQMIHLKFFGKQYNYLSGLLRLFNSKIPTKPSTPIGITVHFFYHLKVWHPDYTFQMKSVDMMEYLKGESQLANQSSSALISERTENPAFTNLISFGCCEDPFASMRLVVGWPSLTEDVVSDEQTYSDLDPNNAPEWYFSLQPNTLLDFSLHKMLEAVWNLQKENKSIEEVLGKKLGKDDTQYTSALDKISLAVSPLPVVNRVISNVNKAQKQLLFSPINIDLPPIEKEELDVIMFYLFPDATSKSRYTYPEVFDKYLECDRADFQVLMEGLQGVKSAPIGSLVWRLAIILSYHTTTGYGKVAHIWAEVILELRYRWENSLLVPGLEPGSPNSGTCLLNQKLQMLNCCIEKKRQREKREIETSKTRGMEKESPDESEDEFFDCDDTLPTREESGPVYKACGRLKRCGTFRLFNSGDPLYIPITQDPAPLTEDGFEEQTKMLVQLGDNEDGTEKRAKLMSASLTSDMQAFKAANPGCCLEDFVRWYSPRDWIEHEDLNQFGNKKGELSPRMNIPGNLWMEVWSSTTPIPATQQKRLFDDTREAEKILSWMSSRTHRDISQLIFPCLAHVATLKLLDAAKKLNLEYKVPATIIQNIKQFTRCLGLDALRFQSGKSTSSPIDSDNHQQYDTNACKNAFLSSISQTEREICQLHSFQQKFVEMDLNTILNKAAREEGQQNYPCVSPVPFLLPQYIKIDGGHGSALRTRMRDIFQKEVSVDGHAEAPKEFKFGDPVKKVFSLRCPHSKSIAQGTDHELPQRMTCSVKSGELKVASTFSKKTDLD